jgi:transposase-like protein
MTKVSLKVKIQAVEEYLTGTEVKAKVARKYGIRRMLFRILVGIYEKHGPPGVRLSLLIYNRIRKLI